MRSPEDLLWATMGFARFKASLPCPSKRQMELMRLGWHRFGAAG